MIKVKAAIVSEKDKPLIIDYASLNGQKKGEVLVEIKSTRVCHKNKIIR
jgi:S-(hydroxymethyl)glutathione dehydrogenase/alcohol dehydrogenase